MYLYLILAAAIVILDRISKIMVMNHFSLYDSIPLIQDIFHLTYTQNTGGAFSIFRNNTFLLTIFSFCVIIIVILFFLSQYKKYPQKKWLFISIAFIFGGAVGNLIDRISFGYVIDYFDFRLINFAIFNVADCFITVGAILFCVLLLFDKEITI